MKFNAYKFSIQQKTLNKTNKQHCTNKDDTYI